MGPRVQLVQGGKWDVGLVERELGVPPLPIPPVLAPVLTIDGQVEPDAGQPVAEVHARTVGTLTAQSCVDRLARVAAFLQRANTSLRGATRDHVVGFVNARTVESATRASGSTWARDRAAIKQPMCGWARTLASSGGSARRTAAGDDPETDRADGRFRTSRRSARDARGPRGLPAPGRSSRGCPGGGRGPVGLHPVGMMR